MLSYLRVLEDQTNFHNSSPGDTLYLHNSCTKTSTTDHMNKTLT